MAKTTTDFEHATAKLQAAGIDAVVEPGAGGMRVTITGENAVLVTEVFGQHGQFVRYEIEHRPTRMHLSAPMA
jgi:hypothetical protein